MSGQLQLQNSAQLCRLSVWLQQFQPSAPCQLSCTRSERLHTLSSAFECTSPAVFCQLIGNMSALLYSVTQCCSALFSFSHRQSGKCAVGAGAKCSDVAALTIAGSRPRAAPGHRSCQFWQVWTDSLTFWFPRAEACFYSRQGIGVRVITLLSRWTISSW